MRFFANVHESISLSNQGTGFGATQDGARIAWNGKFCDLPSSDQTESLIQPVKSNNFIRAFDHRFSVIAGRIVFWILGALLALSLFSRLWLMLSK